jgi:hypothetical protein
MKRINSSATNLNKFLKKNFNLKSSKSESSLEQNKTTDEIPSVHGTLADTSQICNNRSNDVKPSKSKTKLNFNLLNKVGLKSGLIKTKSKTNNSNIETPLLDVQQADTYQINLESDYTRLILDDDQITRMSNMTEVVKDKIGNMYKIVEQRQTKQLGKLEEQTVYLKENAKDFKIVNRKAIRKKFNWKELVSTHHLLVILILCLALLFLCFIYIKSLIFY